MDVKKHIYCVPGDRLCVSDERHLSDNGTYVSHNYIYSSLAGVVIVEQQKNEDDLASNSQPQKRISVVSNLKCVKEKMPSINSIVTCRIVSVSISGAKCQINCVNDQILRHPFKGVLNKEDIRAVEKDEVEVHECFKPRDIILARVFGISDKGYCLTTAEDELGVVIAYNDYDSPMVPISWTEVVCPETYVKEKRKVAQIITRKENNPENKNEKN